MRRGEAEAMAQKKKVEAENSVSSRVVMRELMLEALSVAPEVARELMAPAKAITEIKVLQTGGMNGGSSGGAAGGVMSPILKTIMEAGAAYPLMKEMMSFAQVDDKKLGAKVSGLLGELGTELESAVKPDADADGPVTSRPAAIKDDELIEVKENVSEPHAAE